MIISKESKNNVITALIAIVMSLGITITPGVFENELKDYYICGPTLEIGEFLGGISGTAYSAYPFSDSRKSVHRCGSSDNGGWMSLSDYAKENDIDPYELIVPKNKIFPVDNNLKGKLSCNIEGCWNR